jgi:hypothetical protein
MMEFLILAKGESEMFWRKATVGKTQKLLEL